MRAAYLDTSFLLAILFDEPGASALPADARTLRTRVLIRHAHGGDSVGGRSGEDRVRRGHDCAGGRCARSTASFPRSGVAGGAGTGIPPRGGRLARRLRTVPRGCRAVGADVPLARRDATACRACSRLPRALRSACPSARASISAITAGVHPGEASRAGDTFPGRFSAATRCCGVPLRGAAWPAVEPASLAPHRHGTQFALTGQCTPRGVSPGPRGIPSSIALSATPRNLPARGHRAQEGWRPAASSDVSSASS